MKKRLKMFLRKLVSPLAALIFAFVLGSFIILLINESPLHVYTTLLKGAFGGWQQFAGTLLQTTPIIVTGTAACFAFNSGVFNIGIEGQLYVGGFAAAWVGFAFQLPRLLHLPLALVASMVAGMLWALVPAYFRARYNTSEVVSTILLNYVAVLLTSYLTIFVFKRPGGWSETPPIYPTAYLPRLFSFSRLNVGLFISIALAIGIKICFERTALGYNYRTVGSNPFFAEYGGINSKKVVFWALIISGVIAGLAGGIETLGVHRRFMEGFAPGFGSDGLTAALMAGADPIGTVFTALFFGALRAGSLLLEVETRASREIITVLQALIILFVSAEFVIVKRKSKTRRKGT